MQQQQQLQKISNKNKQIKSNNEWQQKSQGSR